MVFLLMFLMNYEYLLNFFFMVWFGSLNFKQNILIQACPKLLYLDK